MVLVIDGLKNGVNWHNFTLFVSDQEAAFDLLSTWVREGFTLQKAALVDGDSQFELPIEAFDGSPFGPHLHDLQKQWEEALKDQTPQSIGLHKQQLQDWNRRRIAYYVKQINHGCDLTAKLEKALQKTRHQRDTPLKDQLIRQYEWLLHSQNQLLSEMKTFYQRALDHLHRNSQ